MSSVGRLLTRPRYDETLYSAFARTSTYLGSPPRARLHNALFGIDLSIFDDLPVGIGQVVACGTFGPADVDGAVHEWTLFPYYAHFAPIKQAREAARRMQDSGQWPHEALGCGMAAPARLRFCPSCRVDMLEQHADAWWRRSHQLPSTLVCPDHGETLIESMVTRERRRTSYVAATEAECPRDAPAVAIIDEATRADLLTLARAGDMLLDMRCDTHPDDRREGYLQQLNRLGMTDRAGQAKLAMIVVLMDVCWPDILCYWPGLTRDGLCSQGWLGALLMGAHGSPPLHHLLLEGGLTWAETRQSWKT